MRDFFIESSILVNDRPIKEYRDENNLTWTEARDGSAYSIKIKNNAYGRKLIIISVDGINVITGEPATKGPQDGYILDGFSPLTISGWRVSDSKVKEFMFSFNKEKAYAVKLGQGKENLGVIGILVYDEQYTIKTPYTMSSTSWDSNTSGNPNYRSAGNKSSTAEYGCSEVKTSSMPTLSSCSLGFFDEFQAGTAKGQELHAPVVTVEFKPGNLVSEHTFYYDSYSNLQKRGIIKKEIPGLPKPFSTTKYCPDL